MPIIKGIWLKDYNTKGIHFKVGNNVYSGTNPEVLRKGLNIFGGPDSLCNSQSLILGLKDDRLYVSAEFKDLKNEETIGDIEFNHWKLYTSKIYKFKSINKKFEGIR